MKKILLGLGILPLLTLPVIGLVSCGASSDGSITPDPETTTDLKITAKPLTQPLIEYAITNFISATTDDNKIIILSTVFYGIKADNFNNFTVQATPTNDTKLGTIVLTAKTGFSFGISPTLSSILLHPTLDEEVAKFARPVQTKTPTTSATDAIKSINDPTDATAKLEALKVLANVPTLSEWFTFEVKSAIVNKTTNTSIDVSIDVIQKSPSETKNIIFMVTGLKASPTTTPTLDEEAAKFATPVATKTPTTSATDAIKSINDPTDAAAKLEALKVLANVPTLSNGFNFEVKSAKLNTTTNTSIDVSIIVIQEVGSNAREATLTITGLAPALINIKIVARPSTQAKIDEAITAYNEAASDNVEAKKAALRLVFNGTDKAFDNFTVKATATSGTTPGTITLTAKPGFTINGTNSITSALAPIVQLDISAKSSTQAKIDEAITKHKAAGTDKAAQLSALRLIFDGAGLTELNLVNFDVTTPTTTPPTIVLMAKPGFTINGEQTLSSSLAPIVHLNITAKLSTPNQIDEAITKYRAAGTDKAAQLSALVLIFEGPGLTEPNLENLDVTTTPGIPGTVTLMAKSGFTINRQPNLSSWVEVNLDIRAKPSTQPQIDDAITAYRAAGTDKTGQITALKLIFEGPGLIETNLGKHIRVTVEGTPGTIRLIASYGSSINGEKNLSSTLAFKTLEQEANKFKLTATKVKTS